MPVIMCVRYVLLQRFLTMHVPTAHEDALITFFTVMICTLAFFALLTISERFVAVLTMMFASKPVIFVKNFGSFFPISYVITIGLKY